MSDQVATDLVTVTINGDTVQAEKGRLLIDVAEEMGIFVPRFCYHPGMKAVAVCRMCLIQVEGQRKLVPACATPVDDGMKANTVDPEAVEAQKDMLELLLINHPLDCPICDRAGECPLQDQTYRHGPGSSRYVEEKRTYQKALEISNLIVLDRERCVLCWRCVRFSDEIAGDRFIQLVDRGDGTQILNFADDPFDSVFSGNTVQICPVGALLSKPYRFVSRPWDLETAPSVCGYCSVGCPITNEARSQNLVRCQALPNENVNDFWVCDKGRYGYHYVSSQDRLETPLMREDDEFRPTGWGEAMDAIAAKLKDGARVGVIAGGHLTTEDAFGIARLARKVLDTVDIDSRLQDAGAPYDLVKAIAGVAGSTAKMKDVESAQTIVWAGPDPKEALPVLYLHIHKAVKENGAKLIVLAAKPSSLDALAARIVRPAPGEEAAAARALAEELTGDGIVVCWGPAWAGRDETALVGALAEVVGSSGAGFLMCPPHAGSQGMIDMGVLPMLGPGYEPVDAPGRDTRGILEAAAAGELDALLLFGADPITDFPDAALAAKALGSGVFTVVMELFPTQSVLRADVVLPSAAYAEREGTFTNLERRLQKLEPLLIPPGTAREPWKACAAIARALGSDWGWRDFDDVWEDLRKEVTTHGSVDPASLAQERPAPAPYLATGFAPENSELSHANSVAGPGGYYPKGHRQGAPFQTGQSWPLSWELRAFESKQRPGLIPPTPNGSTKGPPPDGEAPAGPGAARSEDGAPAPIRAESAKGPGNGFALLAGRLLYDEGEMVSRTSHLRALQRKPYVGMNEEDARAIGVREGQIVIVAGAGSSVHLPVVFEDVARGAVFVPYHQGNVRANTLIDGSDPVVSVRPS